MELLVEVNGSRNANADIRVSVGGKQQLKEDIRADKHQYWLTVEAKEGDDIVVSAPWCHCLRLLLEAPHLSAAVRRHPRREAFFVRDGFSAVLCFSAGVDDRSERCGMRRVCASVTFEDPSYNGRDGARQPLCCAAVTHPSILSFLSEVLFMSCLCNLFDQDNLWWIIIVLLLVLFCSACG